MDTKKKALNLAKDQTSSNMLSQVKDFVLDI